MGFASFNFSEYGNSVQNILVSLEIEIPVYDVGLLCDSGLTARVAFSPPQCCAPVHGCPSPSALRLRPLSPSRVCRLSAVPPCTAARNPSRLLRRRRCRAPVHGRPGPQPSPRPAGAVPTRRARFLVRSGTSYFRSDRTHEFVWWKWKVWHAPVRRRLPADTHTYTYDEYDTFQYFLVDGYKQYALRYLISDFLLCADNVNQPDLPISFRCFSPSLYIIVMEFVLAGQGGMQIANHKSRRHRQDTSPLSVRYWITASRPSSPFSLSVLNECYLENWVKIFW